MSTVVERYEPFVPVVSVKSGMKKCQAGKWNCCDMEVEHGPRHHTVHRHPNVPVHTLWKP